MTMISRGAIGRAYRAGVSSTGAAQEHRSAGSDRTDIEDMVLSLETFKLMTETTRTILTLSSVLLTAMAAFFAGVFDSTKSTPTFNTISYLAVGSVIVSLIASVFVLLKSISLSDVRNFDIYDGAVRVPFGIGLLCFFGGLIFFWIYLLGFDVSPATLIDWIDRW